VASLLIKISRKEEQKVKHSVPKATLGRIPIYIQYLRDLPEDSGATISATKIARGLSLGEVQVRKDLAVISGKGKPRVGYDRMKLINDLEKHLGSDSLTNAILVGVGKLGSALLDYGSFQEFGVKIIAGFDCNENILQTSKNRVVLPMHDIEAFCADNDVKIGIITVGQGSAQEVYEKLVNCGIKAIWNFAPCVINGFDGVIMKQENLALSLAHLNSQIKNIK
jgi:redox-sensing transcriptional repressor